jgi:hypothetical protein
VQELVERHLEVQRQLLNFIETQCLIPANLR